MPMLITLRRYARRGREKRWAPVNVP